MKFTRAIVTVALLTVIPSLAGCDSHAVEEAQVGAVTDNSAAKIGPTIPSNRHQFWLDNPSDWPYYSSLPTLGNPVYEGNQPNEPGGKETVWSGGLQGVAHDETNWYFVTKDDVYRWDKSKGTPQNFPTSYKNFDRRWLPGQLGTSAYDHFSDADFVEEVGPGLLYVPIEAKDKNGEPALVVLNRQLQYVDSEYLPDVPANWNNEMPWVSVHPLNTKLVFTSMFNGQKHYNTLGQFLYQDPVTLSVYKDSDSSSGLSTLSYMGEFDLYGYNGSSISVQRIQGGEFSEDGYLSLAAEEGTYGSGVYIFDLREGHLAKFMSISFNPSNGQEIEGLTIWNLNQYSPSTTWGIQGNVHAFVYEPGPWYDSSDDRFWFKHWTVSGIAPTVQ